MVYVVLPIGKKAVEYVRSERIWNTSTDAFAEIADISVADCFEIAILSCAKNFDKGTFGHVELMLYPICCIYADAEPGMQFPVLPLTDIAKEEQRHIMSKKEFVI